MAVIAVLALAALSLASARPLVNGSIPDLVKFADANWNCQDVLCKLPRVHAGTYQPNYACAEFVSRTAAAGGYIPLDPLAAQANYGAFHAGGKVYNLLCCGSKDANPSCHGEPGLADYLVSVGWKATSSVKAGTACFVEGSDGYFSHAQVGVADGLIDAHNSARYHVAIYETVDLLLDPPN
eukprot:TRINITY_DN19001_c0_g1_i1.p2 TRINITY_DN19001_c0_g1~~TRINITY_DN19001_c0_g1_i1.p2  ORF type:complete len:181 (+),score=51.75 TRINITY_DN19001_c0_g1_i1:115-657(+)